MTKEEAYGAAVGSASTLGGMLSNLIDFKGLINAVLIAVIGAFVGAVIGFFTKRILNKLFK